MTEITEVIGKKTCEICGKEVSAKPGPFASHLKRCKMLHEAKTEPAKETPMEEPKKVKHTVVDNIDKAGRAELELIKQALDKEQEFLKAPDAFISDKVTDPHLELRKIYAPETLEKVVWEDGKPKVIKPERHAYIADPRDITIDVQRGYVPKLDGHGRFVRAGSGGILTTCSQDMFERTEKKAQDEAARKFRNAEEGAGVDRSTIGGETVDASGVKIEKIADIGE